MQAVCGQQLNHDQNAIWRERKGNGKWASLGGGALLVVLSARVSVFEYIPC